MMIVENSQVSNSALEHEAEDIPEIASESVFRRHNFTNDASLRPVTNQANVDIISSVKSGILMRRLAA
jgi:hypothetical protein